MDANIYRDIIVLLCLCLDLESEKRKSVFLRPGDRSNDWHGDWSGDWPGDWSGYLLHGDITENDPVGKLSKAATCGSVIKH